MTDDLKQRSVRTLAWLGDVEFERIVRYQLVKRGDFSTRRLDTVRANVSSADAQAQMLALILDLLTEDELGFVGRGRNASVRRTIRARQSTQAYRDATALEVLVALWTLDSSPRTEQLILPLIEARIDEMLGKPLPKRG